MAQTSADHSSGLAREVELEMGGKMAQMSAIARLGWM